MRVNAINRNYVHSIPRTVKASPAVSKWPKVISLSEYLSRSVAFTGQTRNKEQVIFIGAESDPYSKAGGVGTVMKDYRSFTKSENEVEVLPYYGAEKSPDGSMRPLKDKDGNYIMHTTKEDIKLKLVAQKQMQWGKNTDENIMLFNIKDDKDKSTYFVFTDSTAAMNKPYANGFVYRTGEKAQNNGWYGDPYAQFSKAAVELMPEIIKDKENFDPATIVCSDSQTAYVVQYMAQKSIDKDDNYTGIKPTYVGHNMGPGYCGETSMQNMFVNLGATPEQIEKIEADPMYKDGLLGDKYFEPFVEKAVDETGTASAVMVPIYYAKKDRANGEGYVKALTVVAEEYAKNLAENPQAAHNIHQNLKQLYEEGAFNGICNPLNDTSVNAQKKLPNARYNEDCKDKDGTVYPAFEVYPENPTYEQMRKVKDGNKLKLLQRFSAQDTSIISGAPGKTVKINPEAKGVYEGPAIKPELIEMLKSGKGSEVPLFVSWGRIDTQKGHDITLGAFEKFAKTEEGKNAVLILGAGLDNGDESKKVEKKITEMLKDPDLQGRIVHIDGWAPAYALASAADSAIFSSRFEPCGLTDLEAMKYYCTPIVTNTQGLKQKNFDPRIPKEADKATSYKTKHEFNLLKSQVEPIIKAYVSGNKQDLETVKKEYPVFASGDSYDDSVFKEFADKYSEKQKSGENLSYDGSDWDELSKDYSFRFNGFARNLKDGILTAEMADAISASVTADKATKEKIFNNIASLQTGWQTNGNLHPDGKSSYEAYEKLHLDPDYSAPAENDNLAVSDDMVSKTIQKHQKNDIQKRVEAYTAGALTGLGALVVSRIGKRKAAGGADNKVVEMAEASKRDAAKIADLEKQIVSFAKSNRRNIIVAGVCSAAAAILATYCVMKRKADKDKMPVYQDTFVPQNSYTAPVPQLTENITLLTHLTPSFNEFKGSLAAAL